MKSEEKEEIIPQKSVESDRPPELSSKEPEILSNPSQEKKANSLRSESHHSLPKQEIVPSQNETISDPVPAQPIHNESAAPESPRNLSEDPNSPNAEIKAKSQKGSNEDLDYTRQSKINLETSTNFPKVALDEPNLEIADAECQDKAKAEKAKPIKNVKKIVKKKKKKKVRK